MILYDQDFNFIGMSAETLTFLGYEDIDEFSSMHNDFADLFVKKEGYIHKFENFSWIHYVLFSGAANKKAFVQHKNGSELPVDITIKEVFLNHTYDGLRKVYSVKLINENFTHISKTDVHDSRSPKSSEFSLKKLTKDLDIPSPAPDTKPEQPEPPTHIKPSTPLPEPIDFTLDLPEEQASVDNNVQTTIGNPDQDTSETSDFILNIPSTHDQAQTQTSSNSTNHIVFGSSNTAQSPAQPQEDSKFDLIADINEPQKQLPPNTDNNTTADFAFDLLKSEDNTLQETSTQTLIHPSPNQNQTQPNESERFSFDLFKKTEDKVENTHSNEDTQGTQTQETKHRTTNSDFTFDLLKTNPESSQEKPMTTDTDANLINQIKSDIAEIDADTPIPPQDQQQAKNALEALLKKNQLESKSNTSHQESVEKIAEQDIEDIKVHANSSDSTIAPLFEQTNTQDAAKENQEFEETLKHIFSIPAKTETNSPQEEKKSNHLNIQTEAQVHKQPVTKEAIQSNIQDLSIDDKETLVFPKLGTLGLSKEEELDFIEEFLEDTSAMIDLMQEYLNLEDYNNVKYSLVKISSSAEILHFDQMLEYTQAMIASCDQQEKDVIAQKLETLKKMVARYKEHYATIVA